MSVTALLPSLIGLSLGMRHALEPDHLAAVSALASDTRGGTAASLRLGVSWGLGHTLSLLVVGGSFAFLGTQMPNSVALGFEVVVAFMVSALGLRAIRRALAEGKVGPERTHRHGQLTHTHAAAFEHLHVHRWTLSKQPLLIGLVHGLAGSGALTAMVLAELPTTAQRLSYIALFGMGSIIGMALLTGLAGIPLMRLAKTPRLATGLLLFAGMVSTTVGALWGWSAIQSLLIS